jgi:hypothetical protein
VDAYPRLRQGNISVTGVYYEGERNSGDVGTVQWLYLSATEQGQAVEVMARVVRVGQLDDVRQGIVPVGMALEFMPSNAQQRQALQDLVQQLSVLRREGVLSEPAPDDSARPPIQVVHLETEWDLSVGEPVLFDLRIRQKGARSFEGRVVEVAPIGENRFGVSVEVLQEFGTTEDAKATADTLFTGMEGLSREQLAGALDRIRLGSLLSFFELERISGELSLNRGSDVAILYIMDGQLVDVVGLDDQLMPRQQLAKLVTWTDGSFEFSVKEVERADRIGINTTALLLELAMTENGRD